MRISDWSSDVCSSDLPNMRTSSDTGARVTKSRVFDLGSEWQVTDKLRMRAEVALSTSKSDFPNFSTTLDFINSNGPQPQIGRSIDNGVPIEFDIRGNRKSVVSRKRV